MVERLSELTEGREGAPVCTVAFVTQAASIVRRAAPAAVTIAAALAPPLLARHFQRALLAHVTPQPLLVAALLRVVLHRMHEQG